MAHNKPKKRGKPKKHKEKKHMVDIPDISEFAKDLDLAVKVSAAIKDPEPKFPQAPPDLTPPAEPAPGNSRYEAIKARNFLIQRLQGVGFGVNQVAQSLLSQGRLSDGGLDLDVDIPSLTAWLEFAAKTLPIYAAALREVKAIVEEGNS
jgi:hypothetical protein